MVGYARGYKSRKRVGVRDNPVSAAAGMHGSDTNPSGKAGPIGKTGMGVLKGLAGMMLGPLAAPAIMGINALNESNKGKTVGGANIGQTPGPGKPGGSTSGNTSGNTSAGPGQSGGGRTGPGGAEQ
jgi:hypothetical protein